MCLIHGDSQVEIEENLINVTLLGAFNDHAVIEVSNKIKMAIEAFEGEPFTMIINALSFNGATPEAYMEANKHNKWLNKKNMLGKAIVHNSRAFMELDFIYKKESLKQNIKEFSTVKEAKLWLSSLK